MLEVIYTILSLLTLTLCVFYLVVLFKTKRTGEYYTSKIIKVRTIVSIVLFVLFCLEVVLDIILAKSGFSLGCDIFCAVLWAISSVGDFYSFKKAKNETSTIDIHIIITPCFDDEDNKVEGTEENDMSEEAENK